jgi:hypothetical protein
MNGFTQAGLLVYFFYQFCFVATNPSSQTSGRREADAGVEAETYRYCILTATGRKVVYFVFCFTARNILHACGGSLPAHTWHFLP